MPVLTTLAVLACAAGFELFTVEHGAVGSEGGRVPAVTSSWCAGVHWRACAGSPLGSEQAAASQARTFTGAPVSLDFEGADVRAVLRTFADISGLNVVVDPSVRGTVDVTMRDVPWDQALDAILRANKLGFVVDGPVVRVAPLAVLAEEEKQRRKLAEEQALSGELRIVTRTLNYARAEDVVRVSTCTVPRAVSTLLVITRPTSSARA